MKENHTIAHLKCIQKQKKGEKKKAFSSQMRIVHMCMCVRACACVYAGDELSTGDSVTLSHQLRKCSFHYSRYLMEQSQNQQ